MRKLGVLGLMLCCTCSFGCFGKSVSGTWIKDKTSDAKSPIAAVSFCNDGTFTAHAEYGNNTTHVVSGHWEVDKDVLCLDIEGTQRKYGVGVTGDCLTLTHEGKSSQMTRLKPR